MKPHLLFATLSFAAAGSALAISHTSLLVAALPAVLGTWYLISALTADASSPRWILRLGGLKWTTEDFCRGWIITGQTGSGKTLAAINAMLWQVTKNSPKWGGVCLDDKGLYWETLTNMMRHAGRSDDLVLLKVRPESERGGWLPPHTFNFLDYPGLSDSAKAKGICDVGASLGQGGDQPFFRVQAHLQIEFVFRLLREADMPTNLEQAFQVLSTPLMLAEMVDRVRKKSTDEADLLLDHHKNLFEDQPAEQLGGVKATVINRLKYFAEPDLAAVFCAHHASFDFRAIDQGKVVCVSIPQRFQVERRYIHTLLKLLFASHATLRFDRTAAERARDNLLIFWGDEAQKIVTSNNEGSSDYNIVDVIREARATMVFATQSYTSLIPAMGDEIKARVLIANLANRITFKAADEESARIAADTVGKRKVRKITEGWSGGRRSRSWTEDEKYRIEPHEFRQLKKFQAVVQHCETGFRRVVLPPQGADGRVAKWYRS